MDFVYDDPQRGKENLDPHELINPLYSKQELEKLENDKLRFSKENSIKLQKRIADESFSEIYLVSPTSTITKIEVQNPQRHEAEKLAMQTSHDNLVVYVFMYKNSGSVVYYFDQMRILSIDCDADAGVATLLEENKNLVKKLKINKHKLEELVSTPVDDLYEFISSILAFSGIVLKSF